MNPPKGIDPKVWEMALGALEASYSYQTEWDRTTKAYAEHLVSCIAHALSQAIEEERALILAVVDKERVLPLYVNPDDATDGDKAYDMAIDHVMDAIRNRSNATTERNEG